MSKRTVVLIREGRVEYYDLCAYTNVTREEFFNECGLKRLLVYGLVLETDDVVKILYNDDQDDDTESEGIVIPKSCVIDITYFQPETQIQSPDGNVN